MSSDTELRGSIAAIGCRETVLVWLGATLDGRRRLAICGELEITPPLTVATSLGEACALLWLRHPDRAVRVAQEHSGGHAGLAPSVREIARLCGVSVARVAVVLEQLAPPKEKDPRGPQRSKRQRSVLIRVWAEPQLRHYVRLAGASVGMNLSATMRHAAWVFVQETLRRPPTEGSSRAPSPEMVKRPERRRLVKKV